MVARAVATLPERMSASARASAGAKLLSRSCSLSSCSRAATCANRMVIGSPWINACVGHANQIYFIGFTGLVPLGCGYAVMVHAVYLSQRFGFITGLIGSGNTRGSMRVCSCMLACKNAFSDQSSSFGLVAAMSILPYLVSLGFAISTLLSKEQQRTRDSQEENVTERKEKEG